MSGSLGEHVGYWVSYGLKQGHTLQFFLNHPQLPNIIILLSFFVHFIIISSSTELIFDYIEVFLD